MSHSWRATLVLQTTIACWSSEMQKISHTSPLRSLGLWMGYLK